MADEPYSSDKPCLIVHADIPMSRGRRWAQGAHASFRTYGTADKGRRKASWRDRRKKVVPTAPDERTLHDSEGTAGQTGIPSFVHGTGVTGIPERTITVPGRGPATSEDPGRITTMPSQL
jgi:PTH2 family peptidyl-tRNA hydrolase